MPHLNIFTRMIRKISIASILAFVSLGICAQPKVKYAKTDYDLGNIAWHTEATAAIKITNSGNKPLQITNVDSGCECTVVSWEKAIIAPGSSTTLNAVYKAETLGTFRRELAITTNAAEEPTYIALTGRVRSSADNAGSYSKKVDNVLLSTELIDFDNVVQGDYPTVTINIENKGKKPYVPEFMQMPTWLTYRAYPEVLAPGRSGRVTFTLDSNLLPSMGLTQTKIYVARYPSDKIHKSAEISVCATLVPQRAGIAISSDASSGSLAEVPVAYIPSHLPMGKKFGKKRVHGMLYLENRGTAPLHVSALQVYNPAITVVLTDATILPGHKEALKVTTKSNVLQFKQHPRILIITDDPARPQISLDLTADEPED